MKKLGLLTAVAAALSLTVGMASAVDTVASTEMEKCKVVDKDGKGLIKEHKTDCNTAAHSCATQNLAGEAEAWIMVPKGQCEKINAGDFSEVSQDIQDKIEMKASAVANVLETTSAADMPAAAVDVSSVVDMPPEVEVAPADPAVATDIPPLEPDTASSKP